MKTTSNAINWFEIPVSDSARAKKFYETVFTMEMSQMDMMGMEMTFFPIDNMSGKVSGALVKGDMHKPSKEGALVYINAEDDLQGSLDRVAAAGGQVVMPKTLINEESGYMAFIIDTEGNQVGMHSMS